MSIFLFWFSIALLLLMAAALIVFPVWRLKSGIIALVMSVGALLLYQHLGASSHLKDAFLYERQKAAAVELKATLGSPQAVIEKLEARLKDNPNSARGWFLLGRLYATTQQFQKSFQAFSESNKLQPGDPDILMQLAQASYFANQNVITAKTRALINQALTLAPHHPEALNLLAIDAYEHHHYKQAIHYWQELLKLVEDDVQTKEILLNAIAKAKGHMTKR